MAKVKNLKVASFVRDWRARRQLTQEELATVARVGRNWVQQLELGEIAVPGPDRVNRIKKVLGFPGWALLEEVGYETDVVDQGLIDPGLFVRLATMEKEDQRKVLNFILEWLPPAA